MSEATGYKGIQLSLKRASDNALLNIAGQSVEEFSAIKALLKDDPDLAGFFGGAVAAPAAPAPAQAPQLRVVASQTTSANTGSGDAAPLCETCGTAKTWKPGGVSKAGKPYQGFWGCPNYRDGSH